MATKMFTEPVPTDWLPESGHDPGTLSHPTGLHGVSASASTSQ
jgi:hypothetical protein